MNEAPEVPVGTTPVHDAEPILEASSRSLVRLGVRVGVGLLVLLGAVALLGKVFRAELQAIGHGFVDRFGLAGMALGSMIADAFHFPIPPQFYMLMGITSGVPTVETLIAVNIGSFLGAWLAYFASERISKFGPIRRRLEQPRRLMAAVFARYGAWSVVVASFLPITYSALCYMSGLARLPRRGFFLITLIRVPRLVAYYYLVKIGWSIV
jgi:membrane protein YqaA with SNARE-associated domain